MKHIVVTGGVALALGIAAVAAVGAAATPAAAQTGVSVVVGFGVARPYWPGFGVARHPTFFRSRPPIVVLERDRYHARPLFVDRVWGTRARIERRHRQHHHDYDDDDER